MTLLMLLLYEVALQRVRIPSPTVVFEEVIDENNSL